MNEAEQDGLQIVIEIFEKKCSQLLKHRNPNIYLKSNSELFSDWFEDELHNYDILKLGANAHPDLIINGVGIELKSLQGNSQIQFNSTIPCGGFKHDKISGECYYAIARYKTERKYGYLEDFTICDGDFFNHDRQRAFSHLNLQETGFGDYGDGVCRHRKMYSFPSPLRKVTGISLISKFSNVSELSDNIIFNEKTTKIDSQGNVFDFYIYRHKLLK